MLIAIPIWDTTENQRSSMTACCLTSLVKSTDARIITIDNGSTDPQTISLLKWFEERGLIEVIRNKKNLGYSRAINQGWRLGQPDEIRMMVDNDCCFLTNGWSELLEEAFARLPEFGVIGLPIDCEDYTSGRTVECWSCWQSTLILKEFDYHKCCVRAISPACFSTLGYIPELSLPYGYSDALLWHRATRTGYRWGVLTNYTVRYLDASAVEDYRVWKIKQAEQGRAEFDQMCREQINYYEPDWK